MAVRSLATTASWSSRLRVAARTRSDRPDRYEIGTGGGSGSGSGSGRAGGSAYSAPASSNAALGPGAV
jgi:hypothetical protein